MGCYLLDAGRGKYLASAIRAFLTADLLRDFGVEGSFTVADFPRFGLPTELDGP